MDDDPEKRWHDPKHVLEWTERRKKRYEPRPRMYHESDVERHEHCTDCGCCKDQEGKTRKFKQGHQCYKSCRCHL
jgi:hypothetical protein